jgi:hypothetical protein
MDDAGVGSDVVSARTGMLERAPDTFDMWVAGSGRHPDPPPPELPSGVNPGYGTAGHRPFVQPTSLAPQVQRTNAPTHRPGRPPAWVPSPARTTKAERSTILRSSP